MEVHIHETPETLRICEKHLRALCQNGGKCPEHHYPLPYIWQVCLDWSGWFSLKLEECEFIEKHFSDPKNNTVIMKIELPDHTSHLLKLDALVKFEDMRIIVKPENRPDTQDGCFFIRRLTTMTYVKAVGENESVDVIDSTAPKYCTQWRWYYEDPANKEAWQPFEEDGITPMQWTIEDKYEAGQEVYRFEAVVPPRGSETFMINFTRMTITNPRRAQVGVIKRRPLFLSQEDRIVGKCLSYASRKIAAFNQNIPSNWYPLDPSREYELVPLNPEGMEYHLVASEFIRSLPKDRQIFDVFRIQNAFLWHKYYSKKLMLQQKKVEPNELQLFHGTSPESVVQSIFKQNFDWRLNGKNMVMFGRGSYFARNAAYSDKYTGNPGPGQFRWMFMARVITGRSTRGNSSYVRPPPIDATNPHSDLFDSCVDKEHNPSIFVIFDSDQVYPEYVVSYR